MTPKFYTYFSLLQKSFFVFNQKCDCTKVSASITFKQLIDTKNENNDYKLWKAKFSSEVFENQEFCGTIEQVSELITIFIEKIITQVLEVCIANIDEWYKNKPEVKKEIYNLHSILIKLGNTV